MKKRIAKFDNFKLLLIFSVVLGHSLAYVANQGGSVQFLYVLIYTFHMPAFVFMSGMFSRKFLKQFTFDKVCSYFLLFFLIIAVSYLTDHILGTETDFSFAINHGSAWYAFAIMVFSVLIYVFRNCDGKWLFGFSLILSLVSGLAPEIDNTFSLDRLFSFFPYFVAGVHCPPPGKNSLSDQKEICQTCRLFISGVFAFPDMETFPLALCERISILPRTGQIYGLPGHPYENFLVSWFRHDQRLHYDADSGKRA